MSDLLSMTSKYSAAASQIRRTSGQIALSTAQLSSGNRIQQASQDVAALSNISSLRTSLASLRTARMGLGQANSLLQIADGGLSQITEMLVRMQSLALNSTNGALSNSDRNYLNIEFMQLMAEIDRTAKSTMFGKTQVIYAPKGVATTGTSNSDTIIGSSGADTITALESNDLIYAAKGDDTIKAGVDKIAGLRGSVYLSPAAVPNLAAANAYIAANPADATFAATSIDYPNGPVSSGGATVGAFLGVDAASLSNPAVAAAPADQMIYVFEGTLNVPANGTYSFNVASDDGFELLIDGVSVSSFAGLRGFGFTNANVTLTQGAHDIRLVYFENLVGNGLLFNSDMFASGIVDSTATEFVPLSDGDDTIYGGQGNDVVELTGIRSDYEITEQPDGSLTVRDLRPDSPDGTDRLQSVERLRFKDGEEMFFYKNNTPPDYSTPTTLRFDVISSDGKTFDYDIANAAVEGLFDAPENLNLSTLESARSTITAVEDAIRRVTAMRAYVGSKQSQAGILEDALNNRVTNMDAARAELEDTNIAEVSTRFAMEMARQQAGISVAAQADLIRFDSINALMEDGLA